jgi:hypothetical protein
VARGNKGATPLLSWNEGVEYFYGCLANPLAGKHVDHDTRVSIATQSGVAASLCHRTPKTSINPARHWLILTHFESNLAISLLP